MTPDNNSLNKKDASGNGNDSQELEDLVKRRVELDRKIEDLRREVTVLFTDMRGSTSLYSEKGDSAGRAAVALHNQIVIPVIKQMRGQVVKTIGDGIMAAYTEAKDAVESACRIQRLLKEHNKGQGSENEIHIRIGINSGRALVEKDDVYGDVVNTASRLMNRCEVDSILISRDTYDRLDPFLRNLCGSQEETRLRGKATATETFEVLWDATRPAEPSEVPRDLLVLEVFKVNDSIRITLNKRPEGASPISHYQERKLDAEELAGACKEVVQILKRANRNKGGTPAILDDLKKIGKRLYDGLLPPEIKKELQKGDYGHLLINMDDQLVQVPWELLYDGKEFLCNRYAVGRHVRTVHKVKGQPRTPPLKAKFLVISDPQGNLQSAAEEGKMVEEAFADSIRVDILRKNGRVNVRQVVDSLDQADMVHFCGHADYEVEKPEESGWILADGKLTAGYIADKMAGGAQPLPSLVFSNACQTGKTEAWSGKEGTEIYGLANAFLIAGVQHFVGTFWEIMDTPSAEFAVAFYRALVTGESIGRALQTARREMISRFGSENLIWASYLLYGDPTRSFFGKPAVPEPKKAGAQETGEKKEPEVLEVSALRQGRYADAGRKRFTWGGVLFGAAIVLFIILMFYIGRFGRNPIYIKGQEALAAGNYEDARKYFRQLKDEGETDLAAKSFLELAGVRKETERIRLERDAVTRERIKTISDTIKAGKDVPKGVADVDTWHSQPYTVILAGVDYPEGDSGAGEAEIDYLNFGIFDVLKGLGRFTVTEREEIDAVLQEIELSAGNLTDEEKRVRVGRLLGGHVLVTGVLHPNETGGGRAIVKIINVETSDRMDMINVESASDVDDLAESLGNKIAASILVNVPFRGTVVEETDGKVKLDLGKAHGIIPGDTFGAISDGLEGLAQGDNIRPELFVAVLRVSSTLDTTSEAVVDYAAEVKGGKVSLMGRKVTTINKDLAEKIKVKR